MKLNEKYSISENAHGYTLEEKTVISTKKDGKFTGEKRSGVKQRFYGTLYQALQGFLVINSQEAECESMFGLRDSIVRTLDILGNAKESIKDEFCVYVKKA